MEVWRVATVARPPPSPAPSVAQALHVLMHASEPAVAIVLSSTQTSLLMPPSVWQSVVLVLGFLAWSGLGLGVGVGLGLGLG